MDSKTNFFRSNIFFSCVEALPVVIAIGGAERRVYSAPVEGADAVSAVSAVLPFSPGMFLLFALLVFAFFNLRHQRLYPLSYVFSGIFAVIMLAGEASVQAGTVAVMAAGPINAAYSVLALLGWFFSFVLCFRLLSYGIGRLDNRREISDEIYDRIFGKHPFIKMAAVLFAAWLPYAIVRFPAGIEYDGYHQLLEFFGYEQMTTHWAPASSAAMGIWVWLGKNILGSESIGVFVFVLVQMAVVAASISFAVNTGRRLGAPKWSLMAAVLICAVVPMFPGFATSVVKDTLFSAAVLVYVTLLVRYLYLDEREPKNILGIAVVSLVMAVLRSNGIFLIAPEFVLAVAAALKAKGKRHVNLAAALLASMVLYTFYSSMFLPLVGVKPYPTEAGEAFSVPFQQTASVMRHADADVSSDEKTKIAGVLDAEELADRYDPALSDPVKATYHGDKKELVEYFKVWAAQGMRHPVLYVDAVLNMNGGFIYPGMKQENGINCGMYRTWWPGEGELDFTPPGMLVPLRSAAMGLCMILENFPVTFLFGIPAVNIWLAFALMILGIKERDWKLIFVTMPSVVGAAVCMASPTYIHNGARYALPIIFCSVILVLLRLGTTDEKS